MIRPGRAAAALAAMAALAMPCACSRTTQEDAGPAPAEATAPQPAAQPALPGEPPPPATQPVALHFADEMGMLAVENRNIDSSGTVSDRVRRTVEALLAGPRGRLRRVIPADTHMRALYLDADGTATLDLDAVFARGLSGGSADAVLAVWSIVDTLSVSFAEVHKVKLLIEGEERRDLGGHLDLSRPLAADLSLVAGSRRNP